MAHIVRVTTYDFEFRGHVTSIYKRGFFGDKLLYKYVIAPCRFEIPGIINSSKCVPAIPERYSRYETRTVFAFLWNYKQPNLPDLQMGQL